MRPVVDAKAPYIIHKHNVTFQFRASDSQIYMNFKPSMENGPLVGTDFVIERARRVGRPRSDSRSLAKLSPGFSITRIVRQFSKPRG